MVIPRPARVGASAESRPVALGRDGFTIARDDASRDTARLLRAALEASTGWNVELVPARAEARPNSVTLAAGAGGIPTLRRAPLSSPPKVLEVPAADIEDAPRYAWRGVHLGRRPDRTIPSLTRVDGVPLA